MLLKAGSSCVDRLYRIRRLRDDAAKRLIGFVIDGFVRDNVREGGLRGRQREVIRRIALLWFTTLPECVFWRPVM